MLLANVKRKLEHHDFAGGAVKNEVLNSPQFQPQYLNVAEGSCNLTRPRDEGAKWIDECLFFLLSYQLPIRIGAIMLHSTINDPLDKS